MDYTTEGLTVYLLAVLSEDIEKEIKKMSSMHLFTTAWQAVDRKDLDYVRKVGTESSDRLERKGWVEDPDLGWVIKNRMDDCFAKKVLKEVDGHIMFGGQRRYTVNEICLYLTKHEHIQLREKEMEMNTRQREDFKQKKLDREIQATFK